MRSILPRPDHAGLAAREGIGKACSHNWALPRIPSVFVIQDQILCDTHGRFASFGAAMAKLQLLASIPGDQEPNRGACTRCAPVAGNTQSSSTTIHPCRGSICGESPFWTWPLPEPNGRIVLKAFRSSRRAAGFARIRISG